ncbi:MAG: hypothetical protein K2M11_10945 [Paramuribaculum sp.]|nr:hypothetical protein [Paramuribaculum sp.]
MNKILLGLTALFAVTLFSACSADDSFLTDDEINQLDKETSSKFIGINALSGNFSEEYNHIEINYAIIFHSKKELEEYGLSGNIVNDTTSYTINDINYVSQNFYNMMTLSEYYKDINWDKQSLVVITCEYFTTNHTLINFDGSIYHKKGKYYILMNPLVQTGLIPMQAVDRNGAAFVVNTPNLKKKDLVIQVNAKVSVMGNPHKFEIRDISKPLDFK